MTPRDGACRDKITGALATKPSHKRKPDGLRPSEFKRKYGYHVSQLNSWDALCAFCANREVAKSKVGVCNLCNHGELDSRCRCRVAWDGTCDEFKAAKEGES